MKAVNLIPSDARRGGSGAAGSSQGAAYVLLAALAVAVVLAIIYVTASNQVSSDKAKVTSLRAQTQAAQGTAAKLSPYVQFATLAQERATTIRGIVSSRFSWQAALAGLARVVPANTSLQSLSGSVVPGVGVSGSSGASSLRGDIDAPAFELTGCSDSQDDVARLISRLRLIDGVTHVSLQDAQKTGASSSGVSTSSGGAQGCGSNAPTFDLVVFFAPIANAGADGVTSLATTASSSTSPVSSSTTTGTTTTTTTGSTP